MQNEESLVQLAKQRDQEAFTQLYEEYCNRIYRYLFFKIGDETEAEDMTQQVFLNAFQSIASFRWRGVPFSAWLFRIAHNQVVDFLRKKAKRITTPLDESLVAGGDNPQQVVEQRSDIEQLLSAAGQLTRMQREVIVLRFASGLSVAEVARVMGKSDGAVKALQHSAIVALRRVLSVGKGNEKA